MSTWYRVIPAGLLLTLTLAACGSGSTPTSPTPAPTPTPTPTPDDTLKAAAASIGRLVGTAVQSSLLGNTQYRTIAGREFNYLTAEYEMKWNVVEPSPEMNAFGAGDAIGCCQPLPHASRKEIRRRR